MTGSLPIFERAEFQPSELAVIGPSGSLTWAEAAGAVVRGAHALRDLGLEPGSRLAVIGFNGSDTLLIYASAILSGVGAILVNAHLTADEIEFMMVDGEASAVWASTDCQAVASTAIGNREIPLLTNSGVGTLWTSLLNRPQREPLPLDLPSTTDLIYTSGTTGRPKGVEVPTQPTPTVADRLELMGRHHMAGLGPHLVAGPLYHAGPHAAVGLLLTGSSVVLSPRFDPSFVLDAIESYGIATSVMVPTHLIRLLDLPAIRREEADVSSLRLVALTGSACPAPVKREAIHWFGPVVVESYGASESGIVSRITPDEWLTHPGSVGRAVPPFHPLVIDADGEPCGVGRDGVLFFRDDFGRGIQYYNDPEKTAAAHLEPGTFTLGDCGHVDADGYLYITGRVTDMVISGGVNIYPAECERVLGSHPGVRDVALFGVPDNEMGERLVGLVSLNNEDTRTDQLIDFCRQSLAAYKVPKRLVRVADVPRSAMGKVDKAASKEAYLALAQSH